MDMTTGLLHGKGKTRKQVKAKKQRHARTVVKSVRELCVDRDGHCRLNSVSACAGVSEWAHMHSHRRSQTRGQEPEERHTTKASFMACTKHHDQFDGRRRPRIGVMPLTAQGADGDMLCAEQLSDTAVQP